MRYHTTRSSRSRGARPVPATIVVLFFLIGLGLAWVLQHMMGQEIAFERSAQTVEGRVIALKETWGSSRHRNLVYAPVFRFTTPDGRTVEAVSEDGSNPPAWSVGETGQLLYDPADPTRATPNSLRGRWGGSALLGLVTLSFFGASILGLRTRAWRLF